ncbi:N-terminal phage integrase SAM-like domain-containing protein [Alicyclobacillus dauci]|uniref:N-terminal phage integrase SAM-like domain-containing protein n=1 Tax=Alicyclobacillus dauci TaxID=1475485 RepID=UPI0038991916
MKRWLEDKKSQVRPGTYRKYSWLVHRHIIPLLGEIELSKLKPQRLHGFYTSLLEAEERMRQILHT